MNKLSSNINRERIKVEGLREEATRPEILTSLELSRKSAILIFGYMGESLTPPGPPTTGAPAFPPAIYDETLSSDPCPLPSALSGYGRFGDFFCIN